MKKVIIFLGLAVLCVMGIAIADIVIKNVIPSSFSEPCLSLTFDDGYKSHYSVVNPLLKEKNFDATFFIFTDHYKTNGDDLTSNYMSISEIKTLVDNGYEIGSHTLSHPNLRNLFREQLVKELGESKTNLEKDFNIEVSSFAFPFSRYNKNILSLSKNYYDVVRSLYPKSFFVQTYTLRDTSDYTDVCKLINRAKKRDLWLIIYFIQS